MLADAVWETVSTVGGAVRPIVKFAIKNVERIIDVVYLLSTGRQHEADAELVQGAINNMKGICIMEKGVSYKMRTCPISQVREYANKYKQYKVK